MYNPYSLLGKTILITGASSGIGRATAIECSRMGASVILSGRDEARLAETLSMLDGVGHRIIVHDLADTCGVSEFVESLPALDGFVSNAGTNHRVTIPFIKVAELESVLNVNTISPLSLMALLVKKKKISRGASVVFTNSVSGLGRVSIGNSIYATSKGALTAFVMGAAHELGPKGIRVNSVCPGMVETEFIKRHVEATDEQLEADKRSYPLKRYGRPEEVAWAIVYLLSDAAAWITGTNLVIDGGRCLK